MRDNAPFPIFYSSCVATFDEVELQILVTPHLQQNTHVPAPLVQMAIKELKSLAAREAAAQREVILLSGVEADDWTPPHALPVLWGVVYAEANAISLEIRETPHLHFPDVPNRVLLKACEELERALVRAEGILEQEVAAKMRAAGGLAGPDGKPLGGKVLDVADLFRTLDPLRKQ